MKIFVNEIPVEVPEDTSILEALRAADPRTADQLAGGGYLTDGVGRRIAPNTRVSRGMIVRTVTSGREDRPEE